MVEITAIEQDKEKRKKRTEHSLRDLWDKNINAPTFAFRSPRAEDREKGSEKIFEEIIDNFPNMGKETVTQAQEAQSPKQDKPKE